MKKGLSLIIASLLSIQIISAQNSFIESMARGLGTAFKSIFEPILTPIFQADTPEVLFAKILFFFLLFAIIFMALKRIDLFDEKRGISIIVSLIVTVLAVRYLPVQIVYAVLLPYATLGTSILILLPFLIFFFFVHSSKIGPFGRRAAWLIYGVVLLGFWGSRAYDSISSGANWIYIIGLIFVILSLIFDKHLHQYFEMGKFNKARRSVIEQRMASLQKSAKDARDTGNDTLADRFEKDIKRLARKL